MRNLTKTLAAVSILAPVSAYSLGIGDIKLHSALNQKLDAEIALRLSADEKLSDLHIRIAPPEKFNEVGVPWNYFLSKIKFKTLVKPDGSTIVKLTSQEVVKEPFLDFLMEVTWAKGNLFREFTVLVDPPVGYDQPIVATINKSRLVAEPDQIVPKYKPRPSVSQQGSLSGDQYGPTGRRDSLWKIAKKTNRHSDVSIEQMMMAIYDVNPKAFYKKNVNALKAGYTLDIPERNIILKLSRKEARAAFKEQDNVWNGRVGKKKSSTPVQAESVANISQLELEAPVEEEIAETVLAAAEDDNAANLEKNDGSVVASSEESIALRAKLGKMEQELSMMQRMLALKDEQIAALQSQKKLAVVDTAKTTLLDETVVTPDEPVEKPITETLQKTPKVKAVEKQKIEPKKIEPVKQVAPKEDKSGFLSTTLDWILAIVIATFLAVLGLFFWRKRKIEEETEAESMFASASEIILPDATDDEQSATTTLDDTALYDVGTVGESSFLSEFTPSDFDAFDTESSDVDPISEADVYLAYGRYQQAEDLMWQAIEDQPDRDECKLKLLEIFYTNENKEAYEKYAKELMDAGKHNDQVFWNKVVEMGSEILPASSVFASDIKKFDIDESEHGAESVLTVDDSADFKQAENDQPENELIANINALEEDQNNVDFDLSSFNAKTVDTNENTTPSEGDNSLDFDLSVFDVDSAETEGIDEDAEAKEGIESVDFNLSSVALDGNMPEEDLSSASDALKEITEVETVDFESKVDIEETEEVFKFDEEIEEDFGNIDFSLDRAASEEGESEDPEGLENFDFDFDLELEAPSDTPAPEGSSASIDDLDQGVSDLTDMDELETKIDLAKAYIDMGDIDAAKSIAEEVLETGSTEQKKAANDIIDQIK